MRLRFRILLTVLTLLILVLGVLCAAKDRWAYRQARANPDYKIKMYSFVPGHDLLICDEDGDWGPPPTPTTGSLVRQLIEQQESDPMPITDFEAVNYLRDNYDDLDALRRSLGTPPATPPPSACATLGLLSVVAADDRVLFELRKQSWLGGGFVLRLVFSPGTPEGTRVDDTFVDGGNRDPVYYAPTPVKNWYVHREFH